MRVKFIQIQKATYIYFKCIGGVINDKNAETKFQYFADLMNSKI